MRCLVERHEEPLAAVWTKGGRIRYVVRGRQFPWINRESHQMISSLSQTATAFNRGFTGTGNMVEVAPAAWTTADVPELFEQSRINAEGHSLTLLWATLPDADGGGAED
jgi:hypothetical protein